jgi:hypothetical protein
MFVGLVMPRRERPAPEGTDTTVMEVQTYLQCPVVEMGIDITVPACPNPSLETRNHP